MRMCLNLGYFSIIEILVEIEKVQKNSICLKYNYFVTL